MNLIMEIHSCCSNIADMFGLKNVVLSFMKWPFSLTLRNSQGDQQFHLESLVLPSGMFMSITCQHTTIRHYTPFSHLLWAFAVKVQLGVQKKYKVRKTNIFHWHSCGLFSIVSLANFVIWHCAFTLWKLSSDGSNWLMTHGYFANLILTGYIYAK